MPKRSSTKISQSLIGRLNSKPDSDYTLYDAELPGFGLRVRTSGSMSFILKYRNTEGRQRFLTLGTHGPITVQDARQKAFKALAEISNNDDPMETRAARRAVLTIGELCDQYLEACEAGRVRFRRKSKSAESLVNDRSLVERHIKPCLGSKPISQLKSGDVEQLMSDVLEGKTAVRIKTGPRGLARVAGGPGAARKAVKLLSTIYNYALKTELVASNPCLHVDAPPPSSRTRWLSELEYRALGKALITAVGQGVNPIALSAIRALALTGCRRNEILGLKRQELDLEGRCLRLTRTKTGPQIRPCGAPALALMSELAAVHHSEWIFPARGKSSGIVNIRKPLVKVCDLAALEGVSAHVFRHSYATVAHELGYSELTIAGLLGHSAGSVTSRYAHHVDEALASAADRVSGTIAERMSLTVPAA